MDRLRATVPAARMAPCEQACHDTDVEPIILYRWASEVALAVFDDVGAVEVAVRSVTFTGP